MASATLSSMTGFARHDGAHETRSWTWEIKTVNARGFEMRCRLPQGLDSLEPVLRKAAQKLISRGAVSVNLSVAAEAGETTYQINERALKNAIAMVQRVASETPCEPPRPESILQLRGVLEAAEDAQGDDARDAYHDALAKSFAEAAEALAVARRREGESLSIAIAAQIDEIEALTAQAAGCASATPDALRKKINAQLDELLSGAPVPEEKLAQEAALLAIKADVREELDRLRAHIIAGRALLQKTEPVGRQLDFLSQEFNREANTLCSKAGDMTLKRIGLDLKKVIDQMREQVQNVE
ncbi:MAG: YicC/YloC family endoribonuclease [Pseudomonadota bacterium]